jgi:hypothetical protein
MSRADAIRARRSAQGTTRVTHAVDRATSPVISAPVISRNSMAGMPMVQKNRNSGRKKVVYTKNTAGAEVRLPAFPVLHPGWRLLSFAIAAASLAVVYFMWTAPLFKVQAASLNGSQRITAEEVNSVLNVSGKRIIELSPDALTAMVQTSFPAVKRASVSTNFPASVDVSVVERQPLIAWDEYGTTRWVDEEGYSFTPRGDEPSLISVNVSTNAVSNENKKNKNKASEVEVGNLLTSTDTTAASADDEPYLDSELVSAIKTIAAYVPEGSQIVYNESYGLGWYDSNGWNVYFGLDLSNIKDKIKMYDAIKAQLLKSGTSPKLISLEYLDAPYYR